MEGAAGAYGGATRATGMAQRVIACTFIKNNIYAEDGGNMEVATLLRERRTDACGRLARVRQCFSFSK